MRKLFLILLAFCLTDAFAQARKTGRSSNGIVSNVNPFLKKQVWLGIKAGVNLTQASVVQSYTVLVPPPTAIVDGKEYKNFNRVGTQAALEVTFYTKGFSISLQPTYRHSSFEYSNRYEWLDGNNANNRLVLNYRQIQQLDHAIIPLLVKYDIAGNKLRPFVQAGIFYSMLINANKRVEVSGTDYASGGANEFKDEPVLVGADDLFANNHWGIIAGAGVNYNLGNVRFTLEANYQKGLSLANSTANRYKNDRVAGVGDALDDIKLNNIVLNIGCLFPMRFLASGFKTLDR